MTYHLAWVTNCPAPYRNHQFEVMAEVFPRFGLSFCVEYLSWRDPRRPWNFNPAELRYPWRLHANPSRRLDARAIHVNPGLVSALRRHPPDLVMVGGWSSPTHVALPFLLPTGTLRVLGCESHLGSVQRTSLAARALKRTVIRQYDAYLVTGARAHELVCSLDPSATTRPFISLPNVIDARLFRDRVANLRRDRAALRARLGVPADRQLWLTPARLAPEKGLDALASHLIGLEGFEWWIAGDGPQRAELATRLASPQIPARLIGQRSETEMTELYAAADVFVLPSRSDPSPLSAIEAAAAGLPLVLSNRVGNTAELLTEGENGWVLDLDDPSSQRDVLCDIVSTPADRLAAMGRRSSDRYERVFDSVRCIENLARFLTTLAHAHMRS